MAALLLGVTSCKQEDEPKYHNPTEFKVNVPALQNQVLQLSSDMGDLSTFNLFCSQPDYGYSAICKYSALVSLDPECPAEDTDKTLSLPATNPAMAAMSPCISRSRRMPMETCSSSPSYSPFSMPQRLAVVPQVRASPVLGS